MEEKGHRSEDDLERRCEAVSPAVEPCDYPATVHCAKCGRWFCDAHAEDEEWHPCMLPGGDGALRRRLPRSEFRPLRFIEASALLASLFTRTYNI